VLGRDGLPAHCVLLYSYSDVAKTQLFIDQKEGDEKRVAIEHLNAIVRYAEDERICRRKPLAQLFRRIIRSRELLQLRQL
jgi:ATP-dependent DNA helicase RecQ